MYIGEIYICPTAVCQAGACRPAAAGLPGALDFLERRSRGHRPRVAGRKPRRAVTRPGRSGTPLATADVQALGGSPPSPRRRNRVDAARPRQLGWYRGLRRPERSGRRFAFWRPDGEDGRAGGGGRSPPTEDEIPGGVLDARPAGGRSPRAPPVGDGGGARSP